MQLLHLLLLHLVPDLFLSNLAVKLVDLASEGGYERFPFLDLPGDIQDAFVFLLHLQEGVTVLDQVFKDLALVFELVLSKDHHIKVLTLRCEVGTELFDLRPGLLNPRLYRV